ncbi:hypothetical protein [Profundibacter sp.]
MAVFFFENGNENAGSRKNGFRAAAFFFARGFAAGLAAVLRRVWPQFFVSLAWPHSFCSSAISPQNAADRPLNDRAFYLNHSYVTLLGACLFFHNLHRPRANVEGVVRDDFAYDSAYFLITH